MATLQKIRDNAGVLVSVVIGMALLAFILGDLLQSGGSIFAKSQNQVAEIDGKSIPVQLYQSKIDETTEAYKRNSGRSSIDEETMNQIQDETWNQLLHEYILEEQYQEVGLALSSDELFDMVQGNNIDPQVMQIPIFQNQETGQFDRNLVIQFLKNKELDPSGNAEKSWEAFEKALVQQKISNKYNNLIKKAMYVTKAQADKELAEKQNKVDFDYLVLRYNNVNDSLISFTETDLKNYYNKNQQKYERPEAREINYVTFTVAPSTDDEQLAFKWISEIKSEFETVDKVEQFVNLNSDVQFNGAFKAKEQLSPAIVELFDAPVGTVIGPYTENNSYKLARVIKSANIPDSVKASHILIRTSQTLSAEAAKAKADSLFAVIKKGGKFDELAKQFSEDGSAQNGGDLGWFTEGTMVGPFNDACFSNKKGDILVVETQFGAHVIKITDQAKATRKVQIAELVRNIEASSKTFQQIYAKASQFGANNRTLESFVNTANTENIVIKSASFGRNERRVANLENPRQLIRWAFETEVGKVSEVFEMGDMFVIAAVKSAHEKGVAPFDDVKLEVEREVKKDKKADYLANQLNGYMQGANTLQAIAEKALTEVKEAKNASFGAFSISGVGVEPQVQANIAKLEKEKISEPIKGNSGVFVVQVKNVIAAPDGLNNLAEKSNIKRTYENRVNYEVFNALKEALEVTDNRSRFY